MSSTTRRLDRLETSLTPKQAVILWMEQAHQFDSMPEYVMSLKGKPETTFPLYMLPDQVEKAIETQMKGKPRQEVVRAVRSAVKDVFFLFHLHQQVNSKLMAEQEAYLYRLRWLKAEFRRMHFERMVGKESPHRRRASRRREDMVRWKDEAESFLAELYSLQVAVKALGTRYFDGHDIPFPAVAEALSYLVKAMETLVEMFNDNVAPSAKGKVEMAGAEAKAGVTGAAHMTYLVLIAKAEALDALGENRAAVEMVSQHLEGLD